MGDGSFNETLLTDKLSKVNSSQQSIESVSRWCISHRKKAKQVVETWEKLFRSAQPQQQVSFLYLSNDILQNSRRKGCEFVNEFWKILPEALKGVYDGGNENCRKVASRLIDIWEERKVFGSRGQNLKNGVLGKNSTPVSNVKNLNPIKVVKRDATSLRIKLAVGGLPEKILTAMQLVHDEVVNEEAALSKCGDAVSFVQEIEKEFVTGSSQGNLQGSDVIENVEKQENVIQQCISELEKSEEIRVALVSQLKEAIQDQETKLEQIRSELLVARSQIEQAANIKLQLASASSVSPMITQPTIDPTFPLPPPTTHPLTSFTTTIDEESKKATAAAVAARLTASTSSAQMLTSILSSLVAEEAASMSTGLKRPKLEPEGGGPPNGPPNPAYFSNTHQVFGNMPSSTTPVSQANQLQMPPPPPPPLAPPATDLSGNQLVQHNSMMGMSYGYGGMAFAQPGPPLQQAQQPASGGYFRPVGVGFYGQPPTMPPVHRQ